MDGDSRTLHDGPGRTSAATEQEQINAEEQVSSLEQREVLVAHREALADDRERLANERELAADVRERTADEREALADRREIEADERERRSDEREQRLNDLEARLDARARSVGVSTETVPERVIEAITRGRALLAASNASLDRSEAAVERQRTHHRRRDEAAHRRAAATGRAVDSSQAEPLGPEHRIDVLREQFLALAAEVAEAEEQIAAARERMPTTDPVKRSRNLAAAREARDAAMYARRAAAHLGPAGLPRPEPEPERDD